MNDQEQNIFAIAVFGLIIGALTGLIGTSTVWAVQQVWGRSAEFGTVWWILSASWAFGVALAVLGGRWSGFSTITKLLAVPVSAIGYLAAIFVAIFMMDSTEPSGAVVAGAVAGLTGSGIVLAMLLIFEKQCRDPALLVPLLASGVAGAAILPFVVSMSGDFLPTLILHCGWQAVFFAGLLPALRKAG